MGDGTWLRVAGMSTRAHREISAYVRVSQVEDAWTGPRMVVSDVLISGMPAVHSEDLRDIPLGQIERLLRATVGATGQTSERLPEPRSLSQILELANELPERPQPIGRPVKGADLEDRKRFARLVANSYKFYVARTPKPALAIAQAEGVPVGTVRRWIREARDLGVLEKGTQGKAG
jgi:hypothetical protein